MSPLAPPAPGSTPSGARLAHERLERRSDLRVGEVAVSVADRREDSQQLAGSRH